MCTSFFFQSISSMDTLIESPVWSVIFTSSGLISSHVTHPFSNLASIHDWIRSSLIFLYSATVFAVLITMFDVSFIFRGPVPMLLNRSPSVSSWSSLRGWTSLFQLICRVWSSHTWLGTLPACDWCLQLLISILFFQNHEKLHTSFLSLWYSESYRHHM